MLCNPRAFPPYSHLPWPLATTNLLSVPNDLPNLVISYKWNCSITTKSSYYKQKKFCNYVCCLTRLVVVMISQHMQILNQPETNMLCQLYLKKNKKTKKPKLKKGI